MSTSATIAKAAASWDFGRPVHTYAWRAGRPKAAILIQHGFGVHSELFVEHYNRLIPRLNDEGIDVYAFDMRGHGRSPGERAATDVREVVDDHIAARAALAELDLPLFVFGHSLGGYVSAGSMARQPDGVAGAIIMSAPFPKPMGPDAQAAIDKLAEAAPGGTAPLPVAGPETLSRQPELLATFADDPLTYKGCGTTNLVAASALALSTDHAELFARWAVPVLVIHGSDDASTDVAGSRSFFERVAAPDKTLAIIKGGRHELLNDSDRELVLTMMIDWLQARLEPRQ